MKMDGSMNYGKEQRNVEILQRKKRKKPRGFIRTSVVQRTSENLEAKDTWRGKNSFPSQKRKDMGLLQSSEQLWGMKTGASRQVLLLII